MSRLATLAVALLLVTAGCTAAGPQSTSSNGDVVTSNESTSSATTERAESESAASETATAAESESASARATDESGGAETSASAAETSEETGSDDSGSSADSDSSASSGESSDDSDDASDSSSDGASSAENDASAGDSASETDAASTAEADDASPNGTATEESDANETTETEGATTEESDAATEAEDAMNATTGTATAVTASIDETATEQQTEWTVTVVEAGDGDSLLVEFPDGHLETVDLVGVDAPEGDYSEDDFLGMATEDGGEAWLNDWGGKATEFVADEVEGREVTIRVDGEAPRRDESGRLLVYVDDGDSATLNADLIERGYAEVADYSFSQKTEFKQEEENAYQGYNGLWRFYEPNPLGDLPDENESDDGSDTEQQTEWTVTVSMAGDGDSLLVEFPDGHLETVDLVGVDAPEGDYSEDDFDGMATEDGGEAWLNDWGGRATEFLDSEVGGREVTIRVDDEAPRRDESGRLLVYVDDGDSATLNADLIERGYAEVADYSFSQKTEFKQEEENAYQGYNGLWRFYEPNPLGDLPEESETDAEAQSSTDARTEQATATASATATAESETATETVEADTETATPTAEETDTESDDAESGSGVETEASADPTESGGAQTNASA